MTTGQFGALDPESGIVYVIAQLRNSTTYDTLFALDPRTNTFNISHIPTLSVPHYGTFTGMVWIAPLRSVVVKLIELNVMYIFTPSKVSESSHGWSLMNTTGHTWVINENLSPTCFMPAYNGSKMVYTTSIIDNGYYSAVHVLDITTWKWTTGARTAYREVPACAVSGDQFIVWSGGPDLLNTGTLHNDTQVYNMKTNKWVSSYIAPPPMATTILPVSPIPTQHNPHATTPSNTGDTSTDDTKLVIIITVVTGVLLIIIMTAIFIYLKTTKRSKSGTQTTNSNCSSSDSLGTVANIDIYGKVPTDALPRDPVFPGVDSKGAFGPRKEQKFTVSGVLGLAGA